MGDWDCKIVREREDHETVEYSLCFDRLESGGGFAFPCDEHGNVDVEAMNDAARANFEGPAQDRTRFAAPYVERRVHRYTSPREGRCRCGSTVYLDRFTNTCHGCGADYCMSGHRLADRSQWGEETGESYVDLLDL